MFYHPFEDFRRWDTFDPIDYWISSPEARARGSLVDSVIIQGRLCEAGFAPKQYKAPDYQSGIPYAYHIDATRFAKLLRSYSESKGVGFVEGRVSHVKRDENGRIASLGLEDGVSIAVDLVVDCTGFDALLIEKEIGADFTEHAERLLCDSAVALPIEHPQNLHRIDPYTKAVAQDHGWIWDIPLWSRRGTGYVYSSAFEDRDSAARRLAEYSGLSNLDDLPFRHIPLRVGYRQEQWVGNCVAIGLSAGFLEPLESTGIYLIERALSALGDLYVGKRTDLNAAASQYNQLLRDEFASVLDFIQMHYVLAHRRDTAFWEANTLSPVLGDRLASLLTQWRYRKPLECDVPTRDAAFGPSNFMAILYGMGAFPKGGALQQSAQAQGEADKYRNEIDKAFLAARTDLESNYSFLSRINSD